MVEITVEMDTSQIGKLGSIPKQAIPRFLSQSAQKMTERLQRNSPEDHGVLKQWFIESMSDEEAHIKSPAAYAAAQNFGAKAHDIFISPKNKSALFWGAYDGKKPIMSKGHTVHIPALPGKHFVEQSFEELQEFTPGFLMRAIEEVQG